MRSIQRSQCSQELEDDIGALSEYLFEKYSDIFDVFYIEKCNDDDIDKSCINCALMDVSENEIIQNLY